MNCSFQIIQMSTLSEILSLILYWGHGSLYCYGILLIKKKKDGKLTLYGVLFLFFDWTFNEL